MTQGAVATLPTPMLAEGEESPATSPGGRPALTSRCEGAFRSAVGFPGITSGEGKSAPPQLRQDAHGPLLATIVDAFRRSPTGFDDIRSQ